MRWLWLMLLTGTTFAQLATPTIHTPTGTYTNMAWTYITTTAVGGIYPKFCLTKDGSTPTAAVAGTCDNNGVIWNANGGLGGTSAMEFDDIGVNTLKVITTMAGQTNSAVATATYTIVSAPALATLTNIAPTKITTSSAGVNYFMPWVIAAPNGRVLLWYTTGARAPDAGFATKILMKYSDDNAATWNDYAPSTVTHLTLTNIGSGYSTSSCSMTGTATCTAGAPVNGAIPSITLTTPGNNYDPSQLPFYAHPILCNVTGGGGTGATCQAWVNDVSTHAIAGVRMVNYGSGYTSTPTCSIIQLGVGNATCTFGAPVNGAITSLTITSRGSGYASPPTVTVTGTGGSAAAASATLNDCEPGDPANCFFHDSAYGFEVPTGGGNTYNNTVMFTADEIELNVNSSIGPRMWRSLDNGLNWEYGFNVQLVSTQTRNPANLISIPPASPGVTGSCAAGCLIQWTALGGAGNANYTMKSYDDGVTWGDLLATTSNGTLPGSDEETAIAWAGGMNLISYTRNARSASNNIGWPAPLLARTTANLGTTWSAFPSNLPTGPCTPLNPNSYFWQDQFTKPSGFVDPQDATKFTFTFGERFNCPSGNTFRWRIVTFDMASTFTGSGQTTPMPQILDLAPGVVYGNGHTTYSGSAPMLTNKILMAWEQAVSLTAEDIFVTTLTYPPLPLAITSASPLPAGDDITPYTDTLTATGGTPAYTWAVTAGSLAACGLTLSAGGVVAGATPTAATCTFTAEVTDSAAATDSKPFSVTINHIPPPPFTTKISGGMTIK